MSPTQRASGQWGVPSPGLGGHIQSLCSDPAPRVKIAIQLPISGQRERSDRGDLTARQVPACPGKPGQVAGGGPVLSSWPDSPARVRSPCPHAQVTDATQVPPWSLEITPGPESRLQIAKATSEGGTGTGAGSSSPPMGLVPLPAPSAPPERTPGLGRGSGRCSAPLNAASRAGR